jgi:glycosyltransferase involved in cell wall biosynthesis
VRFLLVGDGPLRPQVEAALVQEGLAERVVLTGLRRDAPRLLAAMDVFLLTSLWEGLPRTIPEAGAMRLPVVANRADGTNEAIQDGVTGYLCSPGDLQAMAERVVTLLDNPVLRAEMGAHGRSAALGEFDLQVMIARIEDLYSRLLEAK